MKIVIRREQKTGLTGKTNFVLHVRAALTKEEREIVNKNSLANALLVYHEKTAPAESLGGAVWKAMRDTTLTVNSFITGTKFTCKDVGELLGIEDEVFMAAVTLNRYIDAARNFGGEETFNMDEVETAIQKSKAKKQLSR